MSERFCIRGCKQRGVHYATCPDEETCTGCALVEAREGALICDRCFRSLRRHLEDAADLVAHLRSIVDPTKAAVYDRIRVDSSQPDLPAPVAADLIDASNDITRTLNAWADFVAGAPKEHAAGLRAGVLAEEAHDVVSLATEVILDDLEHLANNADQINALCEGVLVVHRGEPAVWTVADAAVRWSLEERPHRSSQPCPACDHLSVHVIPSRGRRWPTRYRCMWAVGEPEACGWEANALDDKGLWGDVFIDDEPPVVLRHDPDLLTLTAAAKLAERTVGTIRGWVTAGDLPRELGRVRRSDVLEVKAKKEGAAA